MFEPIASRLAKLGFVLPPAPAPGGVYKPVLVSGNMIYVSGHGPVRYDGSLIKGVVGQDLYVDEGYKAAQQFGLAMLASMKIYLEDLDRVGRLVKTLGMVNSAPGFHDHPKVINGFSELMQDLWGPERGVGARSAVGMVLPGNIAVEVEAIFELA